jgi:4-amino-4-deoxy-L-arabinose transferase-like glycosyltransferase
LQTPSAGSKRLVSATAPYVGAPALGYVLVTLSCLVPTLLYVFLASRSLLLPGIYYDEVLQAVPAIAALKGGVNSSFPQVEGSVIQVAGHRFPLLILPYLGSTQAGVLTAAFALAGDSIEVMRTTFILLGALPLAFIFLFMRRLFDTRTAAIGALLLAVDPTYVFSTRSDNGPTVIMMICKMAALWLFLTWWQLRKPVYLLAGMFICGVGVYDKMNFVWFLGGVGVALVATHGGRLWARVRSTQVAIWLCAAAAFCAGASLPIFYVLKTGGGPFRSLLGLASRSTIFGVNNTDIASNLVVRYRTLAGLLQGYEILDFYTTTFGGYHYPYQRGWFPTTAVPLLVAFALVIIATQASLGVNWGFDLRKGLFLILSGVLIVAASVVTPTNLMYHHVLVAYPFFHLLAAQALAAMPKLVRSVPAAGLTQPLRRLERAIAAAMLAAALASSLGVVGTYYRVLNQTGGIGMWSDSIYQLADYLKDDRRVISCMDWGIHINLLYLSQGHLHSRETFTPFVSSRGDRTDMERLLAEPGQVFVFHTPKFSGIYTVAQVDPRETFFQTAKAIGATVTLEKTIYQRDGDPLFELYTINRMPGQHG